MGPGYPPGHPPRAYAEESIRRGKTYTSDDVQYSSAPGFHRTYTMPVAS
jgi:hypothetical protein